jgi:hypothetical protein
MLSIEARLSREGIRSNIARRAFLHDLLIIRRQEKQRSKVNDWKKQRGERRGE